MMPLQPSEKGFCCWELQSCRAAPGKTTLPNRTGDGSLHVYHSDKKHTHLVLLFRRASSLYLHNIHRPLANRTFFNGHQILVPLGDPVHWGPMNKQMSLAAGLGSPCPMSGGGGKLYSEVQCIMGNGHMGILTLWTEWQTDTCENITLMQFRGRA